MKHHLMEISFSTGSGRKDSPSGPTAVFGRGFGMDPRTLFGAALALAAVVLLLLPGCMIPNCEAGAFKSSEFIRNTTLRLETLAKDIDHIRDSYFKGALFSADLISKNRISEEMLITFRDRSEVMGSFIDDYGFDNYSYGLLFNTFTSSFVYDVSKSTSMELKFENEFFDNRVQPYDDRFGLLADFFIDNVLLHKINEDSLYYRLNSANPFHSRYLVYDYDVANEYMYNRFSFLVDHAVDRYRYFTATGDAYFRRYRYDNYSRFDDFKSNDRLTATAKLYQFLPGKYFEKPRKSDIPFDLEIIGKEGYPLLRSFFKKQKALDYSIDERDLFVEVAYSYDNKDIKDYTHGDYDTHKITGRAGQEIFPGTKLTVEDSFSIRDYRPEANYYESQRANNLSLELTHRLSPSMTTSTRGSFEFERHPAFPNRDYNRNTLTSSLTHSIGKNTFTNYEINGEWYSYDQESYGYYSYRKLGLVFTASHKFSDSFSAEAGDELIYYDYYNDNSTLYVDTKLNVFSLAGVFRIDRRWTADIGYKREDYVFENTPTLSRDTELFYAGTNYTF